MSIIPHHGYLMNRSKFGQRKNTGYPVFLWLVSLPAGIYNTLRKPILIGFRINLVNIWSNFCLIYFWLTFTLISLSLINRLILLFLAPLYSVSPALKIISLMLHSLGLDFFWLSWTNLRLNCSFLTSIWHNSSP